MTLYRGPGGTGSATSDADTTLYQDFLNQTQAARDAALQAETNAELAETNAETAETNAETAATAAASSASAAASSASSASTSATNAASSASSASTSASNASSSASSASSSASAASTSATNAASSATAAASSASAASTSATNAANSATSASNSASTATTQATNAASSATAAASSATAAQSARTAAEAARDAALSAYDNFDDRYLGPKASDPTLDNDGNALVTGALYFNTATNVMKVYDGSTWVAAYVSAAGVLLVANNLSDVASTATARANLNVPTRTGGDASGTWGINVTGNAATVTNGVYTTGDQTIAGTKTFSSNPILSAGTVNGLAFLNASKVLTTGSALTFDGTNISTALGGSYYSANANYGFGTPDSAGLQIFAASGDSIRFGSRSSGTFSEQMRLTSTGLGIGTSSPSYKLDVNGVINGNNSIISRRASGSQPEFVLTQTGVASWSIYNPPSSTDLRFYNGSDLLTMTSAGNLGLGVTPSAWRSTYKALQTNGGSFYGFTSNDRLGMVQNGYVDATSTSWTYVTTAAASRYDQIGGVHAWYTAPSGTAGNAISFTQAMTLDASGNLLVGTSSQAPLVGAGKYFTLYNNSNTTLSVQAVDGGNDRNATLELLSSGNGGSISQIVYGDTDTTPGTPSPLVFAGYHNGTRTERARIDSSGNFLVGTTSAGAKLHVYGTGSTYAKIQSVNAATGAGLYFENNTRNWLIGAGPNSGGSEFQFYDVTAGAERMRIDSSGNLLVGGTTANARIYSQGLTSSGYGVGSQTTGAGAALYGGWSGSTVVYTVFGNGNVVNTNNSYGAISDAKLKENVTDATPKLDGLMQVRVVNYNLIGDTQKQLGVIAQELEQVFPGMVEETPDRDAEGEDLGTTTKSVKYSVFVPMLIKAIQEQQAIIEQLKADVAALKGN